MNLGIDSMQPSDWQAVRAIYLEGIATGNATFETDAPEWQDWDLHHMPACRLVIRQDAKVIGWAALSAVSSRCVYAGVAEVSIYIAASARGHGVGKVLLQALVSVSEQHGIWTLQAGILAENAASIALHEICGFRQVGLRERIGRLHGVWRDVVLLERRSRLIGVG